MRILGIVLIIAGILMAVFNGFNFKEKKQVAKLGPLEINKTEEKHVGWPVYAGAIIALAGVVVLVAGRKKAA